MGFPVGYSELPIPRMILRVAVLLGCLRRLLLAAFDAVGLGDLLFADHPWPEHDAAGGSGGSIRFHLQQPLLGLEQALPAVQYEELPAAEDEATADGCAVCLCEFERQDLVRRLGNCRHVFHRGCVDRWVMENDQGTSSCPLCRAPLVSSEDAPARGEHSWDSASVQDRHCDDEYCCYCCYFSPTRPTLVLLRQLFPSSSQ